MNLRPARRAAGCGAAALGLTLLAACATQALRSARTEFYAGRPEAAARNLERDLPYQDRVLFLMERGTIRLFFGDYTNSARDLIDAADEVQRLETYSLTRGGASMVANDTAQNYRGHPYEQTLLHSFAAKTHLARGDWEKMAVESRRAIATLSAESRRDYPDVAYARYLAGLGLELTDDPSNAALQYREAARLMEHVGVDERTGRLYARSGTNDAARADEADWPAELVCFILTGRAPHGGRVWAAGNWHQAGYAEIEADGKILGRTHLLSDTMDLAFTTDQLQAARKMAKTVARIAVKETIAYQVERDNELLGELVRLVLIGLLEKPDTRRWETLPRYLHVARVPCPPDLTSYTVIFRHTNGTEIGRRVVSAPLQRRGRTFVSFCRDLPGAP